MPGITDDELRACAGIPIRFTVASRLRVEALDRGLGGLALWEEAVATPYVKDYDAPPGEGPEHWTRRFDSTHWKMLLLRRNDGMPVAAATVAVRTPGLSMLEGDPTRAVLWDLRVHPDVRRRGFGRRVFARAVEWARTEGFAALHVETQNVNVPACRFYAARGAALIQARQCAYPDFPDETMLIWRLSLRKDADGAAGNAPPAAFPASTAWSVRKAAPADEPALLACDPLAPTDAARRSKILRHRAAGECWVATAPVDGNVPVGYMIVTRSFFNRLFVELLCVAPPRRRGAGTALLAHAETLAGGEALFSSTNVSNRPMRRLLAHRNWREKGMVDGLDPGDPELFYRAPDGRGTGEAPS